MKKILLSLFAIILVIEEWLWDALSAFGHFLISLLHLEKFERWLTPYFQFVESLSKVLEL